MNSQKTVFLIDGSAFLYRAFHAIKRLSTSKGHPTNATFGFAKILLKLLKEKQPEYAAIFFDVKGPTFRHRLYDQYKANRPPVPENLVAQIPDIKRVVQVLNIPLFELSGYEADDLVGTYARIAQKHDFNVVMVTGDKDFLQLVTDRCTLWDPMKDIVKDSGWIKEEMGIVPEQFADVLALAGDSSDNIPGIPGVGMKTAAKLIAEFASIDGVYGNLDKLKRRKKLYENLSQNHELAVLSRKLTEIYRFAPVNEDIEAFKLTEYQAQDVFSLFQEFEFSSLVSEFAAKADSSKKIYKLLTSIEELEKLSKVLENKGLFALDTETTSKNPVEADLVGISFSYQENQAFYVPLGHVFSEKNKDNEIESEIKLETETETETEPPEPQITQPSKEDVLRIFGPLLENPDIHKVGQNIKYDYIVLKRFGIELKGIVFDTMIASYLLNPTSRGHSLDNIAMTLFGHKTTTYKEVAGKGKAQKGFHEVAISAAVDYACEDADLTFMAYLRLKKDVQERGLENLMNRVEMPLITVLAKMEMEGIKVDQDVLQELSKIFESELKELEQEIFDLAGETFNINSSKQLGTILFEKLKLKTVKKTKKKTGYSTDVEVLTKLAKSHALPERLLRYRTIDKLKSTYVDALQELKNKETGRIHSSFNQTITATGRLSSSNPNLQNIPIRKEEGRKIRQAFIPKEGCVLLSADYSQIELRILAHCAEDKILIDAFNSDEDIHTRTAVEVFQVLPELLTDDLRSQAKAINFGIVYGMSAYRLSNELGISRKMAQTYIDSYFKRYAGVKAFIETIVEETRKTGEVSTIFGRKRRLDDINSANATVRGYAERAAINTPIQGSSADLIKLSMIKLADELEERNMKAKILLSVHDEIILECPLDEKESLIELTKDVMENIYTLKVPLKVNFGSGTNWAEAH